MTRQELDEDVTETLQTHAVCLYELYHNLNKLKFVHRRVILPQLIMERISENGPPQRGFVLCGLHISNFDLVMMSAGMMGVRGLGITVPSPGGGYRWQNEIRRRTGLELLPGSMDAVRTAVKHLQSGQVVGTGIDWPMPTSKYRPRFFGQPTNLQVMHVQLALMAKVPLAVMAATRRPDGVYQVYSSDLIELQPYPDRRTELVQNTEMLLSLSENIIRQNLRQWVMFYPLWPELQDETP
jgi:lauroyl/myristoyl acyltransferase